MADTLASLEIEVKHKASGAESEIGKVTEAIRAMSRALGTALPQLKEYAETLKNIGGKVKGSIPKGATGKAMSPYWQDRIRNASDRDVALAKQKFAEQDRELALQETGDERGAWKAQERYMRAARQAAKASKESAKGIDTVAKSASKAKGPLEHLIASFKRIMLYRMIRNILKSIGDATQEGLQNAYQFSAGIASEGHRFAAALDSMKSAGLTMKNQLGSAFIGLLAAIAPVVNAIIGLVTRLANALSQIFAIFTGGTYLKAAEVPQKWAEAAGGAGGAAKAAEEWKNQLLGFDEINRLEAPDDGSGGGSGGGGAADFMSMFEDTPIDGIFAKIRDKLIELKNELDFEPLIKSWERLKQAVSGFAEVVGSALAWAWDNVLKPLAHWVIEKAAPVLIELLASAFELLTAVLNRLKPVFQWVWENILKPISKFVGDVFIKFLKTVVDLIQKLTSWISGHTTFKEFLDSLTPGQTILLALAAAFIVVNGAIALFNGAITTVFLAIGGLNTLISGVVAAITSGAGIVIAIIALVAAAAIAIYQNWDTIVAGFNNGVETMKQALQNFFPGLKASLSDQFEQIGEDLRGDLERTKNYFIAAFNSIKTNVLNAFNTIKSGIASVFNAIKTTAANAINAVLSWIQNLINKIRSALNAIASIGSFGGGSVNIPQHASGGFVEDGLFMANHGELVGQFSNGRTAVANNEQIIDGIKQGVIEAMSLVLGSNDSGRKNTEFVLNLNGREFARAIYNDQNAVQREHGQSLISSYRGY